MRVDRIGQAWPRGSRCRRARRLRLQQKRVTKSLLSQTTPAGEIGQPGRTIYQQRAQRLFPVGVLIACVAVILGIVFLLF